MLAQSPRFCCIVQNSAGGCSWGTSLAGAEKEASRQQDKNFLHFDS
jgi:hypothetical protein